MTHDFQHISRSQFVLTYGPGAIIETKNGPRIIPAMNQGLGTYFNRKVFESFEIAETRLSKLIQSASDKQQHLRIVALPTNAGLEIPGNSNIYSTYVFPAWKVCYGRKGSHAPALFNGPKCPICKTNEESSATRFVAACPSGHLDEVNWQYAVHGKDSCNPPWYFWKAGGSSLSDIVIECPTCGSKKNMKEIYSLQFYCTGRTPEKESPASKYPPFYTIPNRSKNCEQNMKIIQRQSTSLRVSETMTLLTIPDFDNSISRILQINDVSIALEMMMKFPGFEKLSSQDFINWISSGMENRISDEVLRILINEIERCGLPEFLNLYHRLNADNQSFMDLMYEEFESLLSSAGRVTDNFSMSSPKTIVPSSPYVPELLVYPVNKIRTVTVQTGYTRLINPSENQDQGMIYSGVYLDGNIWYPGYEGFGEGIFITFKDRKFPNISSKSSYAEWEKYGDSGIEQKSHWSEVTHKSGFVWLHTLSHAIIHSLSAYTGYSAASLRERVYVSRDETNGGILIYNTSPGEDSGMGGLAGKVEVFSDIVINAIDSLLICSNDPLCNDVRKSPESINGAACYSCLLISETSCEHRNLWLDRHLVIGD
jgi:hypothetical protein